MKIKTGILFCMLSEHVFVKEAHTYIDPGTGSMIVQAVIGAIAAVGVSIGVFRRRLVSFLGQLFRWKKGMGGDSDC